MNEEQLDRIRCITEAALLAAGKPLSLDQLRELFDGRLWSMCWCCWSSRVKAADSS